jgi:hypothetical protein
MGNLKIQLALHGTLILAVSMVSGRWFSKAIKAGKSEVAWRVVHSGGSMGGVALIAVAGVFDLVSLPETLLKVFVWVLILGMWVFLVGMIAAAVTGQRGLEWRSSSIGKTIYVMYIIGTVTTLVGVGRLSLGLLRAL